MTPPASALALVESPVQLLHLLEWRHRNGTAPLKVAVLAPRHSRAKSQLSSVASLAEPSGLSITWLEPRLSRTASARSLLRLRRIIGGFDEVIIGDPFSGLIQALLPGVKASRVVVLDDGTATIDFVNLLESHRPLFRWAQQPDGLGRVLRRPVAARAARFFTPREGRTLELFTVMPVKPPAGIEVVNHSYEWTRRTFGPPKIDGEVTVVGSTLVENGILREDAYLKAVTTAVRGHGTNGQYFAHRGESTRKLRAVAERTGLRIVRPMFPLEIELSRGPVGARVVCFPSTPAYSLPYVLRDARIKVHVLDIPASWLRPDAGRRATEFLESIGAQLSIRRPKSSGGSTGKRGQPTPGE